MSLNGSDLLIEILEGGVAVFCVLLIATLYFRLRNSQWVNIFKTKRWHLAALLVSVMMLGIKVSEDAIEGDSAEIDKWVLLFLRRSIPAKFSPFFEAVTLSGAFKYVVIYTVVISVIFLIQKKIREFLFLALSMTFSGIVIYVLKILVGRERPSLWETEHYWGSSFPSGHTLGSASLCMALVILINDKRSTVNVKKGRLLSSALIFWALLVGFSRLVLGVHWPTDVLSAFCIGMLIPFFFLFSVWHLNRQNSVTLLTKDNLHDK